MQLYKFFLIFLLFTYISSFCYDGSGPSVEECLQRELDDDEKVSNVICCLMSYNNDGEEDYILQACKSSHL